MDAVEVELVAQQFVQQEDLTHHVDQVEYLDHQVQAHQIVTAMFAANRTENPREYGHEVGRTACCSVRLGRKESENCPRNGVIGNNL